MFASDHIALLRSCFAELAEISRISDPATADAILDVETSMAFIQHAIEEPSKSNLHAALTKAAGILPREDDTEGKVPLFESVDHALATWGSLGWDI